MYTITARNVNDAYTVGLNMLYANGEAEDTRNGKAWVMPMPVTTLFERPHERVLFNKRRDANPFFHLMEGLWMLAGRNDVEWISQFSGNIKNYSDDQETFHGAYGYRWRQHFDFNKDRHDGDKNALAFDGDQFAGIVNELKENPNSRRAVMQMWDCRVDLNKEGKDFPCNIAIHFQNRKGYLDMTVFNRSNDIIWGAYGANVVHMSMLQEYISRLLGIGIGHYWQVSNNYHAYEAVLDKVGIPDPHPMCPYDMQQVLPHAFIKEGEEIAGWTLDLMNFMMDCDRPATDYQTAWFRDVAHPMVSAHRQYKMGNYGAAINTLTDIEDPPIDWLAAGQQWIKKRMENNADKQAAQERSRKAVPHIDDDTAANGS
jgi:thymidylate synthase